MSGELLPLTERLRNNQKFPTLNTGFAIRDCLEAADEIERLKAIIADRNEAIAVFQDVVERNNIELTRLRGLLREACDGRYGDSIITEVTWSWFERAQAALGGKP